VEEAMPRSQFRYHFPLRVRFAETDMQGIVFNGNYLVYTDTAMTEYFRHLGYPYLEITNSGFDFVLAHLRCDFRRAAEFDDLLEVHARVAELRTTSFVAEFEIYRGDETEPLFAATSIYVGIDPSSKRPTPLPARFRDVIRSFEQLA
jgi:acyl-CoA thioester hydrolase